MEESRANFLDSRAQSTPRNAPARGTVSGRQRRERSRRGRPRRLSPSSVGSFCRALGDSLGPPALGSSPRTARWRSTVATFGESLCLAAQSAGPPRAAGTTLSRYRARCSSQCGIPSTPCLSLSAASAFEWPRFQPGSQFPEGVGASRSAEERRERFWCLVRNTVFQASGHLISHSFYV